MKTQSSYIYCSKKNSFHFRAFYTNFLLRIILFIGICIPLFSISQTTLINPSTVGGFESGTSFAANGWTVVNANQVYNKFYVGTVPSGMTNRSAYISYNGGSSYSYDSDSLSNVHFYRDVTAPAGETSMLLTFNWKAMGESVFWDGLIVSVAPTSYVPVSDTFPVGNGGLGSPTTEVGRFWNSSTVQSASVYLPADAIGNCSAPATFRLIFTWKNDGASGANPPIAIDNIGLVSSVPSISNAGGNYTINNTLPTGGSNFNSFTSAITALNATGGCGFTAPLIFNVSAGQTFNEKPPVIQVSGSSSASISFIKNGSGSNPKIVSTGSVSTEDASIVINGGDYFIFDGIDIDNSSSSTMEFGYILKSKSENNGARNNTIKNCLVKMNRNVSLTTSAAFLVSTTLTGGGVPITSNSGSNSYNKLYDISVNGALNGISFMGSISYPDVSNEVKGLNGRISVANIGPLTSITGTVRGIYLLNQSGVILSNADITSVSGYNSNTHGLLVTGAVGTSEISNNQVYDVSIFGSTLSTSNVYGMQLQQGISGSNTLNVHNNMISDLSTPYASSATSTRRAIGMHVGITGATSSQVYNIYHNTINIGQGISPSYSTSCFEIQNVNAVYHVKNNIFSNFTGPQAGVASHFCWVSTSSTNYGASGSLSDYNDLYIANDIGVSGFVGKANSTNHVTISNWTAAMTSVPGTDSHSISAVPLYINALSNLHISSSIGLTSIESAGTTVGITSDIDGDLRPGPNGSINGGAFSPDAGADEFDGTPNGYPLISLNSVTPSATQLCNATSRSISVNVTTTEGSISSVVLNYSFNGLAQSPIVMVNTSGTTWQGTIPTANPVDAVVSWSVVASNTGGYSATYNGVSYSDSPLYNATASIEASSTSVCSGGSSTLIALLIKNGSTELPITSITWSVGPTIIGSSNPITVSPSSVTTYTASIMSGNCQFSPNPSITINVTTAPNPPITNNSTQCGSQIPTATVSSGSGNSSPTFKWYTASTGGTLLQTGNSNTYLSVVSETSTFYVSEIVSGSCESSRSPITITVTTSDNISASASSSSICLGASVTLTASNLNPSPVQNYAYSWSGSQNSGLQSPQSGSSITITPTVAGSYTYTLSGVDGSCSGSAQVSINVNSFVVTLSPINATCNGSSNGSFSLQSSSCGTIPYSYSVNGGSFGSIPTNLVAGSYTIVVKDANNVLSSPQSIIISQPAETISNPATTGAIICQNDLSAVITASSTVSNGNPATITWWTAASGGSQIGTGNSFQAIGSSVLPNSNTAGTYLFFAQGQNGSCASPARTLSTVQIKAHSSSTLYVQSCNTYTLNGQTYTSSGIYTQTLINAANCDSILTLNLTIKQASSSNTQVNACNSFTWTNGITYTTSGVYTQTLLNSVGCDSIATLNLTINHSSSSTTTVASCGTYTWTNGTTYSTSGTFTQNLVNSSGCDSVATLILFITPPSSQTINISSCNSYFWSANGQTYTSSGSHTATLVNMGGCDSIVTLNLTINHNSSSTQSVSICDVYLWPVNGQTYSISGVYSHTLINSKGCDSIVTLNLTIKNSTSSIQNITSCNPFTWSNGQTYSVSGSYTQHLINSSGCDSTITLNLTIEPEINININAVACESYYWSENGQTYTTSGIRSVTYTNTDGCDSTIVLNLIIYENSESVQNVNACLSYTWTNGITYTQSGTYTQNLNTIHGCDSIATLILTIGTVDSGSDTVYACESFTWDANGATYNISGIYFADLVNSQGCDSSATLYLYVGSIIETIDACGSYTWPVTGITYSESGTYADTSYDLGCEFIHFLRLGITDETAITVDIFSCEPYQWTNGMTYTSSGTYFQYLQSGTGCDSTLILNLTISEDLTATVSENGLGLISSSPGYAYQWINCENLTNIENATSQTFTASSNGTYAVVVTYFGDCTDTSNCVIIDYLGADELSETEFEIYPNPTWDKITVSMSMASANFVLFDENGKILQSHYIENGDIIDLSAYQTGVYFLRITTDNYNELKRVVKN